MSFQGLLRELKGDMSQEEFGQLVGVGQPTVSMLLSGERRPGLSTLQNIVRAFPGRRNEILRLFFESDYHDQDGHITEPVSEAER